MTRRTFSHRVSALAKKQGLPARARKEAVLCALRLWDRCGRVEEREMLAETLLGTKGGA